jgi:hypothetical protein
VQTPGYAGLRDDGANDDDRWGHDDGSDNDEYQRHHDHRSHDDDLDTFPNIGAVDGTGVE